VNYCYYYVGDVQLSQRDHTAGCIIVFAKNEILQLEDNMLHTLYIYIEPLWYNHLESVLNFEFCENMENKGYYGVQGHSRWSRLVRIESPYTICY